MSKPFPFSAVVPYSRVTPLQNADLAAFARDLLGRSLAPQAMRQALRQVVAGEYAGADPAALLRERLPDALRDVLQQPLQAHAARLRGREAAAAAEFVYVMPALPLGEGHAVALTAFAPMPAALQETLLQEHRLMRYVVASFAGGGAAFTAAQRDRALCRRARGRLRPTNVPRPLPRDVVAHNADLFLRDAPLGDLLLLGHNSWCEATLHLSGGDEALRWQTVVLVTTDIHSQDGTVLWTVVRHPAYPDGLIWLSVHYGDHQVPLGDSINTFLAPLLFHPTFERAMALAQAYPELQRACGREAAAELLLNPAVAQRFAALERAAAPARARQFRYLRALDRTAGFLLTSARYLRTARH